MNQKTTIQIFCAINPSEDPDKIKTAVNNIFPEIELDVSETEISGKTNNFSTLSKISKSIHEKNKKVKFVRTPKFEEVPYPIVMEPNLVIEYYSR